MTTKGYHRYRGRNTRGKVALVVVLVLILLAAVAYLLTQEYVVYDDEGKAHLELPWSRKEPEKPQPDSTPVPDDVDITREEPQRQKGGGHPRLGVAIRLPGQRPRLSADGPGGCGRQREDV